MDEGDEGWTWPSWGAGHGSWITKLQPDLEELMGTMESGWVEEKIVSPADGDAVLAEEEAEVEQEVEVGGMEERIMAVKEEVKVEQDVEVSGVEE